MDVQKALVTNYAKLIAAEKKLADLKAAQNNPGDGGFGNSGSGSSSGSSSSGNQSSGNTGNQTTNAPTGDNANFTLPLMGILMSMIVMAGAFAVSKRKKNI